MSERRLGYAGIDNDGWHSGTHSVVLMPQNLRVPKLSLSYCLRIHASSPGVSVGSLGLLIPPKNMLVGGLATLHCP